MNAKPADRETVTFDYGIPAELFMGKRKGGPRQPRYRRFATAAEAIRFAVEEPDLVCQRSVRVPAILQSYPKARADRRRLAQQSVGS